MPAGNYVKREWWPNLIRPTWTGGANSGDHGGVAPGPTVVQPRSDIKLMPAVIPNGTNMSMPSLINNGMLRKPQVR